MRVNTGTTTGSDEGFQSGTCGRIGQKDDPPSRTAKYGFGESDQRDTSAKEMVTLTTAQPTRTTIRKLAGRWTVICQCGYRWHSRHHRLAILFATTHSHQGSAR